MQEEGKTKGQLIEELKDARLRMRALEAASVFGKAALRAAALRPICRWKMAAVFYLATSLVPLDM